MTVKEIYEGVLIEVRKENFPHIHLRDFNHYLNDSVSEIIDDIYIAFEKNQKSLDYLKAIKRSIVVNNTIGTGLTATPDPNGVDTITIADGSYQGSVKFILPSDYRHLTNLIVKYKVNSLIPDDCYEVGNRFQMGSKRLDDDTFASIVADPFQRPRYFEPKHAILGSECFVLTGQTNGRLSTAPLQIESILLSYLKTPQRYALTLSQANQDISDTSQKMEFDDITNRLVLDRIIQKLLERNMDQRTQSFTQINQPQTRQDVLAGSQPLQQ
jgi:hypothetical protein